MKIKFDKTKEQLELVAAMASSNRTEALEAQDAFAAYIADVVGEVLLQAGTAGLIYEDMNYNEDDSPEIPVDLYYGEPEGTISVWQQTVGGGLPTNQVGAFKSIKVSTYELDSAISFDKRYARRSNLDVIARGLERMANEVLTKQERNAWYVILKMLADNSGNVIQSNTDDVFQIDDINKLFTKIKRLNAAYTSGTAANGAGSLTDMFVSPEIMEQVRGFSYQPMNTRAGSLATSGATAVPLPDSVRERIFAGGGSSEIWGVQLHELLELGVSAKYNTLFDELAGSTTYGGSTFAATDEIVVGIDRSRRAFIRALEQNSETGGTFSIQPDDQFLARSKKIGFFGGISEGRVALDARAVAGIVV